MSIADRFVNQTLGYWTYLYDRGMSRWRNASREMDARTYGTEDIISDVLGYWSEIANGWMAAASSLQGPPVVYLHIDPADQAATKEVDVFMAAVPKGEPTLAFFNKQAGADPRAGGEERVSAERCKLHFDHQRQCLRIDFDQVGKQGLGPLPEGTYHGLVHCDDVPLAVLYVRVGPGGGRPSKAGDAGSASSAGGGASYAGGDPPASKA